MAGFESVSKIVFRALVLTFLALFIAAVSIGFLNVFLLERSATEVTSAYFARAWGATLLFMGMAYGYIRVLDLEDAEGEEVS